MSPEDSPTWREVHALMDAKVIEIRREQDQRYTDVTRKLDRTEETVNALKDTMEKEFRSMRQSFSDAKGALSEAQGVDRYKQFIFPTLLTVGLVIIGILDLIKK